MKLAGFNFTKYNIEKKSNDYKNLKISSGINIESIEEVKSNILKTKETLLIVKWKFNVNYEPKIASIELAGNLIIGLESKKSKEILKKWDKKEIDEEFNIKILNIILKKCNIKSVQFEDDFSLPIHFKLPSLKGKK